MEIKSYLNKVRRKIIWSTGIPQEFERAILGKITGKLSEVESEIKEEVRLQALHIDRGTHLLLATRYREGFERTGKTLRFEDVEFRNHSQNGEDGILWYIFSLIGTANKKCIEICASDGIQCNCANLIINDGWTGLLFDGDEAHITRGREYYNNHPDTFVYPPRLIHAWVTAENVNNLITANGFGGEIDLLSLDIDGVDYWIWNAIEAVNPRVVVTEVQAIWGAEASVTVPYTPDFKAEFINGFGVYSGASLPAFIKLGRKKGYRLVGCQRYGFNAFFIRNDIGQDIFPEIDPNQCFSHPFYNWARNELLPLVKNREWQQI